MVYGYEFASTVGGLMGKGAAPVLCGNSVIESAQGSLGSSIVAKVGVTANGALRAQLSTKIIRADPDKCREEHALEQVIRVTDDGWEYKADQHYAVIIVESMCMEEENIKPITVCDIINFGDVTDCTKYLATDRVNIQMKFG